VLSVSDGLLAGYDCCSAFLFGDVRQVSQVM